MSRRGRHSNPISLFSFQDIVTSVTGILILLAILLAVSVIQQGSAPPVTSEREDATQMKATKASLQAKILKLEQTINETMSTVNSWIGATPDELRNQKNNLETAIELLQQSNSSLRDQNQQTEETVQQFINDPEMKNTNARVAELKEKIEQTKKDLEQLKSGSRVVYNFRSMEKSAWLVQISGGKILACRAGERAKPRDFDSAKSFTKFAQTVPSDEQYFVLVVKPSGLAEFDAVKQELDDLGIDVGVDLVGEANTVVDSETGAAFK